jgi:hypothetical protein
MFVTLTPKTLKGQEVVAQHGPLWHVRQDADRVQFTQQLGPWILVESPHDLRWIHRRDDADFLVEPYALDPAANRGESLRQQLTYIDPAEVSPGGGTVVQKQETHKRASRKSPILAAILGFVFGPFGYLYIGWRYAVMAFSVFAAFVLVIGLADFPMPSWIKYIILPVVGWRAWTIVSMRNTLLDTDSGTAGKLNTFPVAAMAVSDLLVSVGMFYAGALGLYAGVTLALGGAVVKGALMIVVGTPLVVWVAGLVFGMIAFGIDAVFAPGMKNLFRR